MPLTKKTDLQSMQIGDYIPCRYNASSGVVGTFSELGTCVATEIPVASTAIPDGLFNFIKVNEGLLIADRIIQHSISWDTLNAGKYIEGKIIDVKNVITNYSNSNISTNGVDPIGTYPISNALSNSSYAYLYIKPDLVIKYDFTESTNVNYLEFGVILSTGGTGPRAPIDMYIEGSNDDVVWDTLYSKLNSTSSFWTQLPTTSDIGKFSTSFINLNSYRYYRIRCNGAISNNGTIAINDMKYGNYEYSYKIRSLSGGCAYADANGNSSATDKSLGAFPINNEWDKYIVNSDLNGNITKGDDNIWHWLNILNWTSSTGTTNTNRVTRGYAVNSWEQIRASSFSSTIYGFRPVLEYLETNSKATTLFY